MRIEVFLNDSTTPFQTLSPPESFKLDTTIIADGKHKLSFRAIEDNGDISHRHMDFYVQNGPSITIHGIRNDDRLSGEISILANAYGSNIGDEFDPIRMESPTPIPTWAWVLVLSIFAWGAGYISLEVNNQITGPQGSQLAATIETKTANDKTTANAAWVELGEQVYGNNCSSCHQADGSGLGGVFPPLKNNSVVLADSGEQHILAVLNGVSGKVIDGINYASPMPGFSALLDDEQVAAVVNHERTQWGNSAPIVSAEDVKKLR
tara:strand:+ start:9586 stop:10377 length:792 start_codon:yes stop_codon:yes gene_type:complete